MEANYVQWLLYAALLVHIGRVDSQEDREAKILLYVNNNDGLGHYSFNFDTSNGISRSESGEQTAGGLAVRGSYSYTGPDGRLYTVTFVADQTGYHPSVHAGDGGGGGGIEPPAAGFASPAVLASLLG